MSWRSAFVLVVFPAFYSAAPQQQHHVRVSMRCDRDVTGSATVNLYANGVFVNESPTEIFCGDNLAIATTAEADSYATTASLTTPDGPGFCTMPVPEPLPDTVTCTAVAGDPHAAGATIRLHKPK